MPDPFPSQPPSGFGDALAAPWPARGVPEHEPIRCIGRGAYGEVWLARNALGALRAVKLVHRNRFDTDRPYEREFEGLRRYEPVSRSHPGLMQILQVGRDDMAGFFYCIMELADPAEDRDPHANADNGYVPKTLHRVLRRRGRLPLAECLDYGLQLVEALEFLHDRGLIHRDLKPSNIIFVQGRLKLGDPGLVTVRDEPASMVGTGAYVPPEGNGAVGADLFALGRVLYEVATGKPADAFPDPPTDLGRHPERDRFREWNELVLRACEPQPERRYASALALHRDLLLLQAGESLGRRRAIERALRRSARLAVATAVVAMVVTVAITQILSERARRLQAELDRERVRLDAVRTESRWDAERNALASHLAVQQVERLFAEDRSSEAIRHLARVVRRDPSNHVAVQRLISALSSRTFGLPLAPPLRHGAEVYLARFDKTGTRVVTASRDGTARVWEVATGRPLTEPLRHGDRVRWAEFSPDGERVVTGSDDGTARLWNAGSGQAVGEPLRHRDAVVQARFSPDGARVGTASSDGTARVWDGRTGEAVGAPLEHEGRVMSVGFDPTGDWVVTTGADRTARLWRIAPGTGQRTAEASQAPTEGAGKPMAWRILRHDPRPNTDGTVVQAAFSPDGRRVATASDDRTARLWDVETGEALSTLRHEDSVRWVEFSPEGARVVTASWDRTARIWDAATGHPMVPPLRHLDRVRSARFSPDGLRVVTASVDQTVRVWDAITGEPLTEPMHHEHRARWAEFHPESLAVVSASEDGTARLWDVRNGGELPETVPIIAQGEVTFDASGRHLLVPGEPMAVLDAARPSDLDHAILVPMPEPSRLVRFHAASRRAFLKTNDTTGLLWDTEAGRSVGSKIEHGRSISVAEFGPDGARLITASFDHTARLWDGRTGEPVGEPLRHGNEVWDARFSPDGTRVVTASLDGTARLWDGRTGRAILPPMKHDSQVLTARFRYDGQRIVTASNDRTVRIWDGWSGQLVGSPMDHRHGVNGAMFSPDGRRVVAWTDDGAAWLWDLASMTRHPDPLRHDREILLAEYSPDGRSLLTTSRDGTTRRWDAATGWPIQETVRFGQLHLPWAAHFDPTGRSLITARYGGYPILQRLVEYSSPAPHWLPPLAAWISGTSEPDDAVEPNCTIEGLERQRALVAAQRDEDPYVVWGRWFLGDRSRRAIAPGSTLSLSNHLVSLGASRSLFGLRDMLLLEPTHRFALLGAWHVDGFAASVPLDRREPADPRRSLFLLPETVTSWVRCLALRHPEDPLLLGAALECLHHLPSSPGEMASFASALECRPDVVNAWIARAVLHERANHSEGRRQCLQGALDLLVRQTKPSFEGGASWLISPPSLLRELGASHDQQRSALRAWGLPPRPASADAACVDLSEYLDVGFRDLPAGAYHLLYQPFRLIAPGIVRSEGVDFDVRGLVQVQKAGGTNAAPAEVGRIDGIPLRRQVRRLHFLTATHRGSPDGTPSARYRLHARDGSVVEIPFRYRVETRHWGDTAWRSLPPSRARPVETGKTYWGQRIQFYHFTWENPRPEVALDRMDLIADDPESAHLLMALTVEEPPP